MKHIWTQRILFLALSLSLVAGVTHLAEKQQETLPNGIYFCGNCRPTTVYQNEDGVWVIAPVTSETRISASSRTGSSTPVVKLINTADMISTR